MSAPDFSRERASFRLDHGAGYFGILGVQLRRAAIDLYLLTLNVQIAGRFEGNRLPLCDQLAVQGDILRFQRDFPVGFDSDCAALHSDLRCEIAFPVQAPAERNDGEAGTIINAQNSMFNLYRKQAGNISAISFSVETALATVLFPEPLRPNIKPARIPTRRNSTAPSNTAIPVSVRHRSFSAGKTRQRTGFSVATRQTAANGIGA
jgi:hypothetical protein